MKKAIGILDLGISNIGSIFNSIERLNQRPRIIKLRDSFKSFDKIIIPGVGSFPKAMKVFSNKLLIDKINKYLIHNQILGICLGMQVFCTKSTEIKTTKGLNLISEEIVRLNFLKQLPNIGYCKVKILNKGNKLFKDIKDNSYFYFMHSYGIHNSVNINNSSVVFYDKNFFVSSLKYNNFYGVQFHPEKSGKNGLLLLQNFINE
tara:strand:- start:704 stop:1315 length:612 start_codon:yes stop_codon:yes gene_type:complete